MSRINFSTKTEISCAVAKRRDDSIRQILVQENFPDGRVRPIFEGYFSSQDNLKVEDCFELAEDGQAVGLKLSVVNENLKFHWTDAFSQEELKEHFGFTGDSLEKLLLESKEANKDQRFVHKTP